MPRRTAKDDPVVAFVIASQQFAQAKANLHEAVRKNLLTPEQEAHYGLLKAGLSVEASGRPSNPTRNRKERATDTESIDEAGNVNAMQAAGSNSLHR